MPKPAHFKDSIETRARYERFRNIGNPYAFLNGVGIGAILEEIYKGDNIVDVASKLNVAIGILLNWLETEGHMAAVENAYQFSAEGHLSDARKLLREAQTDFQLKKAKELASHGRFMASKLDKSKYGTDNSHNGGGPAVQFILHMGDAKITSIQPADANTRPFEVESLPGSFSLIPRLPPPPVGVVDPDPESIGPFEPEPFHPSIENMPKHVAQLTELDPGAE